MTTDTSISLTFQSGLRTFSNAYVLHAYLEQDGDHCWNAWVDALPGCAA